MRALTMGVMVRSCWLLVHFHKTDLDFQVAAARALAQARSRRSLAWATR
jgi:hypothetical protein